MSEIELENEFAEEYMGYNCEAFKKNPRKLYKCVWGMSKMDYLYNVFEGVAKNLKKINARDLRSCRKSITCIRFLKHLKKMHVFKNIAFLRNHSKVLDRWSILE